MNAINGVGAPQIAQVIPAQATPALWQRVWNCFKNFLSSCWQFLTCGFCSSRKINVVRQPAAALAPPLPIVPCVPDAQLIPIPERVQRVILDQINTLLRLYFSNGGCKAAVMVKVAKGQNTKIVHYYMDRLNQQSQEEFRRRAVDELADHLNGENLLGAEISVLTITTRLQQNDNTLSFHEINIKHPGSVTSYIMQDLTPDEMSRTIIDRGEAGLPIRNAAHYLTRP